MNQTDESNRDPYRGVVIVLLAIAALGSAGAIAGGIRLADPVLLAVALTLGISAGVLAGIATAQAMRLQPAQGAELHLSLALEEPAAAEATEGEAPEGGFAPCLSRCARSLDAASLCAPSWPALSLPLSLSVPLSLHLPRRERSPAV